MTRVPHLSELEERWYDLRHWAEHWESAPIPPNDSHWYANKITSEAIVEFMHHLAAYQKEILDQRRHMLEQLGYDDLTYNGADNA